MAWQPAPPPSFLQRFSAMGRDRNGSQAEPPEEGSGGLEKAGSSSRRREKVPRDRHPHPAAWSGWVTERA